MDSTTMLIITFHYYNLVLQSYYTRTKITLEIVTFEIIKVLIKVIIIHILLYRFNYPFLLQYSFFCDFTFYFILNFNFRFKPLNFMKGLTSSAVPQEQFSNNYEVI